MAEFLKNLQFRRIKKLTIVADAVYCVRCQLFVALAMGVQPFVRMADECGAAAKFEKRQNCQIHVHKTPRPSARRYVPCRLFGWLLYGYQRSRVYARVFGPASERNFGRAGEGVEAESRDCPLFE